MCKEEAFVWSRRLLFGSFLPGVLVGLMQLSAFAAGRVTLAWNPSTDPLVVGYNVYYGGASGAYTNEISAGNATNVIISGLVEGATYYFAATAYSSSGLESLFSSEVSYLVPLKVPIVNQPPTLNAINNVVINENAGLQTVALSGITSGATNENQTLTVTAVSSNTGLIPNPTVNYTNAGTTGKLTFTPTVNGNGTATITVTVNDGGTSNNIVTQSFTVTVNAVNQPPTLNVINNVVINENAGLQTVALSGITSGATNENQTLRVTARASAEAIDPCFYAVARSESLALDLAALGLDRAAIARLPLCATIARPSNAAELLGARYVVEGSALGSQLIARALEPSFGENRRFFLSQPGNAWRVLTDLLETLAGNPPAIEAAAGAARAIFLNFEMWMDGWKNPELFAIVGGEEGMELAPPAGR